MFLCTLWASLKNQPSKQKRHKEVFTFKKSNTIVLLHFQGVLKTSTNTNKGISMITKPGRSEVWKSMSQNGEPGQQIPRLAVPSQPSGGLLQSQMSWYHQQPILQLFRFYWCFLTVHFLRQGEGGKYVVLLQVPVSWAFPSKVPWRVEPDIGMATYSERNNSLNIETILLMHFKETTL